MAQILLADDDGSLRSFVKAALEKDGHNVDDCENGAEAWQKLNDNHAYDLLLTDIVMPVMDGMELSAKARRRFPTLKIMFMTGFSGLTETADDANPQSRTISKPFHLKDIIAEVSKTLEN